MTKKLYWIDLNRFDLKPDKSTWLEMASAMTELGLDICILTGIGKDRYSPTNSGFQVLTFRAWDLPFVFRISLQLHILSWLLSHTNRSDIVMLAPNSLFIAPILRILGWRNIQLDFRTVPVEMHSLKDQLDRLLYWKVPIFLFEPFAKGRSYITRPLQQLVEAEFHRTRPDSIVWTSGVNCEKFDSQSKKSMEHDGFWLFYHGSIGINRGLPQLVDAIGMMSHEQKQKLTLILVGDGVGMRTIIEKIRNQDLDGAVKLKGMLPYDDIPSEIALADCCICPLPDRIEWNVSSPLKVFEYMASGKPIILTPIPAHKAIVDNEDFIVWASGDTAAALRDAIVAAMENIDQLKKSAPRAAGIAREKFDWKAQANKLATYIDEHFQ